MTLSAARVHEVNRERLQRIYANPYIPQMPTPKQAEFLIAQEREVLFGGAAGGAKSSGLLMGALEFAEVPGYKALILRRTFAELSKPGAIMSRLAEWLAPTDARWNSSDKTATFPSGAQITCGYLRREEDVYQYQGAEFHGIFVDEATRLTETQIRYMRSRLRRTTDQPIPLRLRYASNPGGPSHAYFKRRFLTHPGTGCRYIPSRIADNPYLRREEYEETLSGLDPTTRRQLMEGDWDTKPPGQLFRREKFKYASRAPKPGDLWKVLRYWDLGGSRPSPEYPNPDWTAGVQIARDAWGGWWILDVARFRLDPGDTEDEIRAVCLDDGRYCMQRMSQDPGQAGKSQVHDYQQRVIPYADFDWRVETGSKYTRAKPFARAVGRGEVTVVSADWTDDYVDELCDFAEDDSLYDKDDQVDGTSGGYNWLSEEKFVRRQHKGKKPEGGPPKELTSPKRDGDGLTVRRGRRRMLDYD